MTDSSPAIQSSSVTWRVIARVLVKAAILLALCNVLFALLKPIDALGAVSLYNVVLPGRERLPYGEDSARSYNLSLFSLPAMFSSHVVAQPKAADEFRVIVIGDSGAWGWLLKNEDTLATQLTALGLTTPDGRRVVAYNLGYPILALTKDLLILDEALKHQPDLIVWPITLDSLPREKQLFSPLVQHNADRVRRLIDRYDLKLDRNDPRLIERSFWDETLIGRRRDLADWLRLQTYGFSWAATGVDQYMPDQIKLRQSDFEADASWQSFKEPATLTEDELAFDALAAGVSLAGNVPVLIVNEPMYISAGRNSDLRYNAFYPHWAYDQYRALLDQQARAHNWHYLDVWNAIAPEEFTDTPVHLTPKGTRQFAALLAPALMSVIENQ